MATLHLVRVVGEHLRGRLLLQGTDDPSCNADFSLFDVDGEGGDPFRFGNLEWEMVPGVAGVGYDPKDDDAFWVAQRRIAAMARAAGIALPDYVP